jgi:hypothetical protein
MTKHLRRLYAIAAVLAGLAADVTPGAALAYAAGEKPDAVMLSSDRHARDQRPGTIRAIYRLAAEPSEKSKTPFDGAVASRMPLTYDQSVRKYPRSGYGYPQRQPRR